MKISNYLVKRFYLFFIRAILFIIDLWVIGIIFGPPKHYLIPTISLLIIYSMKCIFTKRKNKHSTLKY